MRMQPLDVSGILYSSPRKGAVGLRLGWQMNEFAQWTDDLEALRPGAREEIVAEAHFLINWRHRFAEMAFFFGSLWAHSSLVGLLCLAVALPLEDLRFTVFGPSRILSQLSRLWTWIRWPLFLGAAVFLWQEFETISVVFVIFIILQGVFNLITVTISMALVPIATRIALLLHEDNPYLFALPVMSVLWITDRWRRELGLVPRD